MSLGNFRIGSDLGYGFPETRMKMEAQEQGGLDLRAILFWEAFTHYPNFYIKEFYAAPNPIHCH